MSLNFANNNSLSAITTQPSGLSSGDMTLLATQTASGSATLSFTSGIDDTYDSYVFKFYDIHPANDGVYLSFQGDVGTDTNYNQPITSTWFRGYHNEAGDSSGLDYRTPNDQAQGTAFQYLSDGQGNGNDEGFCGQLSIYNPSSSVFVKHFIFNGNTHANTDYSINSFVAGYFNTTTALTRFQFKFSGGNIDSGVIKLYGIS